MEFPDWVQVEEKTLYIAACVMPGRPFMAVLINSSKLLVSDEIKEDLQWWRLFMAKYNDTSMFPAVSVINDVALLSTNPYHSGPHGSCGAICLEEIFHAEFSVFNSDQDLPIPQLELLTTVVTIKLWREKLSGHCTLHSDSETAVQAIKGRHSKVLFMQTCLKDLFLCLASWNIPLQVTYVPGKENCLSDYLSCWHLDARSCRQFEDLTKGCVLVDTTVADKKIPSYVQCQH